jgi:hypothetical protein
VQGFSLNNQPNLHKHRCQNRFGRYQPNRKNHSEDLFGIFLKSSTTSFLLSGIFSVSVKLVSYADRTDGRSSLPPFVSPCQSPIEKMFKPPANRTYHKSSKRKQIDPTTCERDYSSDELEFMQALERYKNSSGRKFPTCSEILEVLRSIGYQKVAHVDASSSQCNAVAQSAEANLEKIDQAIRDLATQ